MNIAKKVRRLLIIFFNSSMASRVDEPILASDIVFDLLALCYGRLAWGRKRLCCRYSV